MTAKTEDYAEIADELSEIKDKMRDLLRDAARLVRRTPERRRAESYWLAHIAMQLDDDHGYLGGSGCTMQETIDSLRSGGDDEEDE